MMKTLIYVVILLVLATGVYFIWYKHNENPYGLDEAGFNIKDTSSIGKMFFANYDGSSILVERTDSCWLLNKKYKALPSMVKMMMNAFYQQQALYPVTKNVYDKSIINLSTIGKKVELYKRNGKLICKYYVGGLAPNNSGTVMLMEGASKPYVVNVPNFNGYLTTRYEGEFKDWRDRTVFNLNESEIKNVKMEYPLKPENSFELVRSGDKIEVVSLIHGIERRELIDHNVNVYLKYFYDVSCEGYLNGSEGLDSSIKRGTIYAILSVESIYGRKREAKIYYMPINSRSKNLVVSDKDIPDEFDSDRYIAIINNGQDTVMIQQSIFKKIFRGYNEFFQKATDSLKQKM